jgi:hypothetical protein
MNITHPNAESIAERSLRRNQVRVHDDRFEDHRQRGRKVRFTMTVDKKSSKKTTFIDKDRGQNKVNHSKLWEDLGMNRI